MEQVRALGVYVAPQFEGLSAKVRVEQAFTDIVLVEERQAAVTVEAVKIAPVSDTDRSVTIARPVHKIAKR